MIYRVRADTRGGSLAGTCEVSHRKNNVVGGYLRLKFIV